MEKFWFSNFTLESHKDLSKYDAQVPVLSSSDLIMFSLIIGIEYEYKFNEFGQIEPT